MLSENVQREDLTDSEKGDAINEIRSESEMSNVRLATKLGVNESSIRRWLQAAGYPEEVKAMTKAGEVTDYSLRPIATLDTPQEQIKTAMHIRDNGMGYREKGGGKTTHPTDSAEQTLISDGL